MTDPSKQERIEELLRKSLLGEELVNTQFHLFSARSSALDRVLKPRVLCANNVLLAKSSKYFLDLLSSDISPSDASLIDLTDDNDVPGDARIDEYGYGSDSDLDEYNDPVPVVRPEVPNGVSASKGDDELSDDGSVSSDMFVMSPEQPKADEHPFVNRDGVGSVASSETAVQNIADHKTLESQGAMRLRCLGSRHVLVKDTAFQTWYTLLNYLYTDKFDFLPLSSAAPGGQPHESSTSSLDESRCSAKSMYRLASKVMLDYLRDEAFTYIRSNLTEHNIMKELSCSLLSKHPELLEMELDVLYSHVASPPVVAEFPTLARRIANKELAHGSDIIIGIHARLLHQSRPSVPRPAPPMFGLWGAPRPIKPVTRPSDVSEDEDELGPSCVVAPEVPATPPRTAAGIPVPSAVQHKASKQGGKKFARKPKATTAPVALQECSLNDTVSAALPEESV